MKTLGLIGGISPESTIEYYRQILAVTRRRRGDDRAPSILIDSIDLSVIVELVSSNRLADLTSFLAAELERLARAGARVGALTANTPHLVFDALAERSPIPLVSIVESARDAARARHLRRVGLIGTRFTMESRFYPDTFAGTDITLVTPNDADRAYVHEKYMGELVHGQFLPETRAGLIAVAARMRAESGIEALILGGTELPIILRSQDEAAAGLPFLDTTQIHVERLVDAILA